MKTCARASFLPACNVYHSPNINSFLARIGGGDGWEQEIIHPDACYFFLLAAGALALRAQQE